MGPLLVREKSGLGRLMVTVIGPLVVPPDDPLEQESVSSWRQFCALSFTWSPKQYVPFPRLVFVHEPDAGEDELMLTGVQPVGAEQFPFALQTSVCCKPDPPESDAVHAMVGSPLVTVTGDG